MKRKNIHIVCTEGGNTSLSATQPLRLRKTKYYIHMYI